ncbi:hypothetical protein J2T38_001640, partial [Neisseria perflava]|nr:hypothetical protein [Neisseria perflava]
MVPRNALHGLVGIIFPSMDNIQDFHLVWGTVYFCTGIQSTKKRLKSNKNADFSRFWRF